MFGQKVLCVHNFDQKVHTKMRKKVYAHFLCTLLLKSVRRRDAGRRGAPDAPRRGAFGAAARYAQRATARPPRRLWRRGGQFRQELVRIDQFLIRTDQFLTRNWPFWSVPDQI